MATATLTGRSRWPPNGATFVARRHMRGSESLVELFRDFHYLIVEERLDPEAVHKAFLVIDEYADLFDAEDE
jgi:hypothetical protein